MIQQPISIAAHTKFANPVTRVALERDGKYLLVQEGKQYVRGLWAFPGGKVDVGEDLIASAKREIMEETGIDAEMKGVLGLSWVRWNSLPGFTLEVIFLGSANTLPNAFSLPDEVMAVEWKTLAEIQAIADAGQFRNPGQLDILHMIQRNQPMPLESLIERIGNPPPEAQ